MTQISKLLAMLVLALPMTGVVHAEEESLTGRGSSAEFVYKVEKAGEEWTAKASGNKVYTLKGDTSAITAPGDYMLKGKKMPGNIMMVEKAEKK